MSFSSQSIGMQKQEVKIFRITGKFGLQRQNEAWKRLTKFCQDNMLVIPNTLSQQPKRQFYAWTSPDCQYHKQIAYTLCSQRQRSSIQSAKTRSEDNSGSDHELLIAKFRLKLKKVEKNRSLGYDYTVEVMNRFKGLDLLDRLHEELCMEVCNIIQEAVTKTIPQGKKMQKGKVIV